MDEYKKYEVIKGLADHPDSSKERAALTLGCTLRHVNRMLAGYKESGKEYFIHGNKGRKPTNTIPDETKITRAKQKRIKKYLKELKKDANTQKEADAIQTNLVAVEDAHSRCPRAAYFGELLQMDATPYEWIPGVIWHLKK